MSDTPWWALTPDQLEQLDAGLPELRELSADEGHELIERLNSHAQHALSPEEWEFVARQPAIRYAADIERLVSQAARENDTEFVAGVRVALDYARGQAAVGPLTNAPTRQNPPCCQELEAEATTARDSAAGMLDSPLNCSRELAAGVEDTMTWLTCGTDTPPLNLDT